MRSLALAVLLAPSPLASADVISVDATDPDNLQVAIDAASAGDVLRIAAGEYSPIHVDKALVLVAEDPAQRPFVRSYPSSAAPNPGPEEFVSAITLVGDGGTLVLHGLQTGGTIDVPGFGAPPVVVPPAIVGAGFRELRLIESVIAAPQPLPSFGTNAGGPAIAGPVANLITISDSEVSAADNLGFGDVFSVPDGAAFPAIEGALDVMVLDSTVRGGDKIPYDVSAAPTCESQWSMAAWAGSGAPALQAERLFRANAVLVGGDVPIWSTCGVPSGSGPSASVGEAIDLPDGLTIEGSPAPGVTFNIILNVGDSTGFFAISDSATAPIDLGGLGWLVLDPAQPILFLFPLATGALFFGATLPADPAVVGVQFVVQGFRADLGFTRPEFVGIAPN